jgi:hypothetical protein
MRFDAEGLLLTATCEELAPFIRNGVRTTEWTRKRVIYVDGSRSVRCPYCHGEIRIHRNRTADGPQDHFEHLRGEDSRRCIAGFYYEQAP